MADVLVTMPRDLTPGMLRAVRQDPLTSCDDKDEENRRIGWLLCAWDVLIEYRVLGVPVVDAAGKALLDAAAKSGDAGAMTLAAQLAGVPPCEGCGYRKEFCRCGTAGVATVPAWPTVDEFAQQIRWLNGGNKMGAASLAEKLLDWLQSRNAGVTRTEPEQKEPKG